MDEFISAIFISFLTLFVIMDPFASLPAFFTLTKGCKEEKMKQTATKAIIIAGILAIVFLFGGLEILKILSITLDDFKIAGGIVLVLMGLENVLNFTLSHSSNKEEGLESAVVLIATPLLTGPGLITTLIVLSQTKGYIPVLIALIAALVLSWIILYNATIARKILGDRVITVFSKIMGLILIALGISFIKGGLAP